VERQNLTMRMPIRRLTRLTNAFSKKWENLWAALWLHFAYYNFCRIHRTLRVTPAMEAGITNHIWTVGTARGRCGNRLRHEHVLHSWPGTVDMVPEHLHEPIEYDPYA
jgi:hypothetical protein